MTSDLRASIVEALNTTPTQLLRDHPESLAFHADQLTWDLISARHDKHNYMATCALCRGEAETLADAVLAVVQPELDRLAALLADHAPCAVCGHERHQHGREPILRRDWCRGCNTSDDQHTFQPEETP